MYDKSLEQLIDAVIADGIITEQERKVVYKKAKSLGIDQDEIEVYLEGRLVNAVKGLSSRSNKLGTTKVCPNCGANIRSFEVKCSECGHEFHNIEAVQSMERFVRNLSLIKDDKKKCELIRTFPIPNDKESLLEFLAVSAPNSKDALGILAKGFCRSLLIFFGVILILAFFFNVGVEFDHTTFGGYFVLIILGIPTSLVFVYLALRAGKDNSQAKAWEIKTNAALNKIKVIGLNDIDFQTKAKGIASEYSTAIRKRTIVSTICGILILGLMCFMLWPGPSLDDMQDDMQKLIQKGDYIEAEIILKKINDRSDYEEKKLNYNKYLVLCITNMCENTEFGDAKRFVNKYKDNWDVSKSTIEELNAIIWKYEHPDEEYIPEVNENE